MRNTTLILALLISSIVCWSSEPIADYRNPKIAIDVRIQDLLSRMTLEEKVGQMNQFVGLKHIQKNRGVMTEEELKTNTANAFYPGVSVRDLEKITEAGLVGSYLHVLTIDEANYLQSLAMKSRLQIPILFGIDAIHGNANAPDNTVYPTNIGIASSFDVHMAYTIARQTAKEMRAMNMHWTFNPNVEVARDPRWGRVGETFGEDPYLVSLMGAASVKGYQGNLNSEVDVLACIKHFVGGSQPINGTNGAPTDLSERTIREVFFPPFKAGVDAGAMSIMMAHNELNGIPCHSNDWLMKDVLRDEWGFKGFVVSDWMDIEHIHDLHATAESNKEAYYQSIMAGMDLHMHGVKWNKLVMKLVNEGRIPESRINESVRKILEIKFRLGLFEQPFADEKKTMKIRLNAEHRATALEASRNSIVLLKNKNILPIAPKIKNVLVTGINADDQNILGDWSALQKDENVTTILEGLKMIAPDVNFNFVDQGWNPQKMDVKQIDKAAEMAMSSDLNIVVAGEYMMRYRWNDKTSGEDKDRSDIYLVGLQEELIRKVTASGKPTVLILVTGRPLSIERVLDKVDAVVLAWEPGMYGGQAVAEILFGKINPSAKLPVSIPRSAGQIQMIYNHKPSQYFHPYAVGSSEPLFHFGYGLSYNTYKYSHLKLSKTTIGKSETISVSVDISNKGRMPGVEIAQLYIRDRFSQVTRPVKELKDFARVELNAGETKTVRFEVSPDKLTFLDKKLKPVVEAGEFIVMVGSSSQDKDLMKESFFLKE